MRKTIATLGLSLLLAAPAFAAKPHTGAAGTTTSSKSVKGKVAQPAGEAKPADAKPAEKPAKKHGGKKAGKKAEGAPAEAAPAK